MFGINHQRWNRPHVVGINQADAFSQKGSGTAPCGSRLISRLKKGYSIHHPNAKTVVIPIRHYCQFQLVPRNWNLVVMQGASIMISEPSIINPAAVLEYECRIVIWNP